MGCAGSKFSLPGFTSSPCTEYTESRRRACKEIIAAHDALLASATQHAEALKGAGGALRVFSGATNIFENPGRTPKVVPAPAPAPAPAAAPDAPAPALPASEGDTPAPAVDVAPAAPAPAPTPAPAAPPALALVAAGPGAQESRQALEEISKKLDALFLEMGGLLTRPLQEVLTHTSTLSKTAMPPLSAASCKIADGRFEPIGNSLQKLLIWEQHLKDDTKSLETVRHDLEKGDKKLQKRSVQASKDPTKDLGKVRGAQDKVNEAQARIEATSKSIVETVKSIEQFKLEVLYPQSARLFPLLIEFYKASEALFQKQKSLASDIAALKPVLGSAPENHEDPTLLTSGSPEIGGGASKGYHDATKGLDAAFTKWSSSIDGLAVAQRKYCAALLSWVRTTMAVPGDFPKPTPEEMAELRPGPNGSKDAESSFAGLANDWTKAVDRLPEAKLREALDGVSKTLKAAFEQQVQEGKEHKKLDSAKKELAKAEHKLEAATKAEEDWKRSALETKDDPSKAKEHEAQEVRAHKATADLEHARTALQGAKNKYHAERVAYEKIVHEECNTAGTALQSGLPEVFQRCVEYAAAAAAGFKEVQVAHAPWVGKV